LAVDFIILIFSKRMSLAINAAPFETDEPSVPIKGSNALRRKNSSNRTVKNRGEKGAAPKISADNINNVLMNIHDTTPSTDEELGEFEPIAPPTPMRGGEEVDTDPLGRSYLMDNGDSHSSQPYSGNTPDMDKYRQYMPDYSQIYGHGIETDQLTGPMGAQGGNVVIGGRGSDPILEKLNHVIHLLEEQQDDKTSHVTEEIILYFLLGVFVIFIVDSFTRLGKYTR
jgi:hypothetical protein